MKVKLSLHTTLRRIKEVEVWLHSLLAMTLHEDTWSHSRPRSLYLRLQWIHWRLCGSHRSSERLEEEFYLLLLLGFEPQIAQPLP